MERRQREVKNENGRRQLKADRSLRKIRNFDYTLLFMVIFILAFGFVMLYSSTAYIATLKKGDSLFYLKRQIGASALGFAALAFFTAVDYHIWFHLKKAIYAISVGLLIWSTFFGVDLNNSSRWVKIGPIQFQPSEVAKIGLIIVYAHLCTKYGKQFSGLKRVLLFLAPGILVAGITALTNLSTAIIMGLICVFMMFVAMLDMKTFTYLGGIGLLAGALFIAFFSYRMDRITAWIHREEYSSSLGYQTTQAMYAIGSGGLFGKGLGNSIQKLSALPEASNDMIFSIICEELGIFGAVCVILMYIMLLFRLFYIAKRAKDKIGSFICIGIMIHLALQVILHIAVVTNLFPNTGVTLPFISYGGTSVTILLGEMGLALGVSRFMEYEDVED